MSAEWDSLRLVNDSNGDAGHCVGCVWFGCRRNVWLVMEMNRIGCNGVDEGERRRMSIERGFYSWNRPLLAVTRGGISVITGSTGHYPSQQMMSYSVYERPHPSSCPVASIN